MAFLDPHRRGRHPDEVGVGRYVQRRDGGAQAEADEEVVMGQVVDVQRPLGPEEDEEGQHAPPVR